jgi:hypothetical protein
MSVKERHDFTGSPGNEVVRGEAVAGVLAGAWRQAPPPLRLEPEALAAAVPLLLQSTAASLGWRRLHASGLHTARPVRPLHQVYRVHALRAAAHEQYLQTVISHLRAAGVEPILIKGWSVARLYPETGLRPYCDLDLCVCPDQLAAAMAALTDPAARLWTVELHQGIPDLRDRTWKESYRHSRLVRLGGVDVRVLCPEDQFRLLCLHQMRHGASAPLWLCDLAVALESDGAGFDWDYCLHGHRAHAAWILCFVGLARRLLGARLDDHPALAARAANLPQWLAPTVLATWARPGRASHWLNPIKSAYRRKLGPCQSRPLVQFLGLVGRLAEIPWRLWRQWRRWRCPLDQPFVLHLDAGDN